MTLPLLTGVSDSGFIKKRVYAIMVAFDRESLGRPYGSWSEETACDDVERFLIGRGFGHERSGLYLGNATVDAVSCVLAVQDLAARFAWFRPALKVLRMLRIEESSDLLRAIGR